MYNTIFSCIYFRYVQHSCISCANDILLGILLYWNCVFFVVIVFYWNCCPLSSQDEYRQVSSRDGQKYILCRRLDMFPDIEEVCDFNCMCACHTYGNSDVLLNLFCSPEDAPTLLYSQVNLGITLTLPGTVGVDTTPFGFPQNNWGTQTGSADRRETWYTYLFNSFTLSWKFQDLWLWLWWPVTWFPRSCHAKFPFRAVSTPETCELLYFW